MNRFILSFFLLGSAVLRAEEVPLPSQRVGLPLEIHEIYIPGAEVKPKPRRDRKPALAVRVLEVKPAKDGFRYDFEVQGFEPGHHNLADYLEAPEGVTIPAIPLEITTALAPGLIRPHEIEEGTLPRLGGYRKTMIILSALWFAGLVAIFAWRKKKTSADNADRKSPATLAERLAPLVDRAAKGDLPASDRAVLERLVIGHWRERMPDIAALSPAAAMTQLRADPEASPLLLAMERWLHSRNSETTPPDIEHLLKPYK